MAKKIKKAVNKSFLKLLKIWSIFITFILGLFGFSNCPEKTLIFAYGIIPEYGVLHANYTINGKITSGTTPIPAIKVTSPDQYFTGKDVTSDGNGNYSIKFNTPGIIDDQFIINFIDEDGAANGSFKNKDITVDIEKSNFNNNNFGEKTVDVELDPE